MDVGLGLGPGRFPFWVIWVGVHLSECCSHGGPSKSPVAYLVASPLLSGHLKTGVFSFFSFFFFFRATHPAYGNSQARGWTGAASSTYTTAHSNARSITHWARLGIKPATSWTLVRFLTSKTQWKPLIFLKKIIVGLQCCANFCCAAKWPIQSCLPIRSFSYIISHHVLSQEINIVPCAV